MKINNKKCFSCIAKHVCGPSVTPKMAMCVNFLKAYVEVLKPSRNSVMDAIAERYINEVSFLDSSDAGVVRSFVAYLQLQQQQFSSFIPLNASLFFKTEL
jgi:hypothetical protein